MVNKVVDLDELNNNVISFKESQLRKMAKEFVDIYDSDGEEGGMENAVLFAQKNIGRENYNQIRKYVQEELLERGYTINATVE